MKTPCAVFIAVLLLAATAARASDGGEALLDAARRNYAAGRYADAAASLDAAVRADPGLVGPSLCLDAATASRLAGDPGRAAWWLYRARRIAPADADVARALAAAGLEGAAADSFPAPVASPRGLWTLVLAANAAFWLGLAWARLVRARLPRRFVLAAAVLLAGLWLAAGWETLAPILAPRGAAIRAVAALSAPEPGAEAVFPLAPGTVVAVGPSRDGFTRVTTRGRGPARTGWVDRDAIATLPR